MHFIEKDILETAILLVQKKKDWFNFVPRCPNIERAWRKLITCGES